ncbi:DUF2637 domain-containing protein [Streptomyces sp. ISL-43]|uniref:DUF2637 domain-containing protein n=1 Tax=Streptomyces sp. ISL-43 TaxID=2819183 RepID=UPI001BEC7FA8|nr:DUF2637 domain-containing protein [Streptomyces sp. ISL-43]MBT2446024.1 DUF2637 domain-containing protein [Streptomyces sp. ISL-43]
MQLTRTHRILIGVVVAGAVVIAGIGFAGSYSAVRALAMQKGFGSFSLVFPIGIDAGICVLLALDLLLTWIRIPFPLLRQTAWLLTAATIAFNGAAAWPDPLGVGMHAVIPILFVVTVEAARHAVGRIADITADRHMEGVRITRWLLSPVPTFKLWRRMKLWELRSYEQAVGMEQDRLIYQARLQARYGRFWRRKAPVGALMPLRLARIGVPLAQTAPEGLAAAGIDPLLLPPAAAVAALPLSAQATATPALPVGEPALEEQPHRLEPQLQPEAQPALAEVATVPDPVAAEPAAALGHNSGSFAVAGAPQVVYEGSYAPYAMESQEQPGGSFEAYRPFVAATGAFPADEQQPYEEYPAQGQLIEPELTDPGEPASDGRLQALVVDERQAAVGPHPFFGPPAVQTALVQPVEAEPDPREPAPTAASAAEGAGGEVGLQTTLDVPAARAAEAHLGEPAVWEASVTDGGGVAARLPEQQTAEPDLDPVQLQIVTVAGWLAEAEEAGQKLAGAEVARRLGLSPKTGQRRVSAASQYLEDQRRQQGRSHLRSVSS